MTTKAQAMPRSHKPNKLYSIEMMKALNTQLDINVGESINDKTTANFSDIQLIMCASHGPRWPGKWLNPTEPEFKKIQNKLIKLLSTVDSLNNEERQNLKIKAEEQTKQDLPPKKHKVIRKAKKLWNSPYYFFRDMLKNNISA